MPSPPQWTVTLQAGADFVRTVQALRAAGLVVSDELDVIGVVNGSAAQRLLPRLRRVPGVQDVAPLLGMDAGPPVAGAG